MTSNIMKTAPSQAEAQTAPQLFDDWFDPIESAVGTGRGNLLKN